MRKTKTEVVVIGIIVITREGGENVYCSEVFLAVPVRPYGKGSLEMRQYKVTVLITRTTSAVSSQKTQSVCTTQTKGIILFKYSLFIMRITLSTYIHIFCTAAAQNRV